MDHAATATAGHAQGQQHQQHPIGLYLTVWGFLFVLWLAMFALLASPRDALEGFAAICGFR